MIKKRSLHAFNEAHGQRRGGVLPKLKEGRGTRGQMKASCKARDAEVGHQVATFRPFLPPFSKSHRTLLFQAPASPSLAEREAGRSSKRSRQHLQALVAQLGLVTDGNLAGLRVGLDLKSQGQAGMAGVASALRSAPLRRRAAFRTSASPRLRAQGAQGPRGARRHAGISKARSR